MKVKSAKPSHYGFAGAIITAVVGGVLLITPELSQGLVGLSYDLPFLLRTNIPVDEVVIVSMDEESHRELNQDPSKTWDRDRHIDLLKQVLALGARGVVFDIVFPEPWPNPTVDERFAQLIASATNKVVLSVNLEDKKDGRTISRYLITNTAPIDSSAPYGVTRLPSSAGDTIRQHFSDLVYRSLAWKTVETLGKIPPDPTQPRWINYYGPRGTIPSKSYHQVLGGTNIPPGYLAGKVVFVGKNPLLTPQGTDTRDEFRTPYSRWPYGHASTLTTLSGVEIQATAFLNLWRGDWLEELSPMAELGVVLLLGGLFGWGLVSIRPWPAVVLAVIGFIIVALVAILLVWQRRVWFPWMIVGGVQIPVALAWSMITQTALLSRQKTELATKLAAATKGAIMPGTPAGGSPETPTIPDHTLIRCVGRGGYGDVWLAQDIVGNFRAVKVIRRSRFASDRPFEREFRGIQYYSRIACSHPGWVHVLHVGRCDGGFFYIMEAGDDEVSGQKIDPGRYVPKTLARELQARSRLPVRECLPLSVSLAEALEHLHHHSLAHRDIKPSNVIFVNGHPKFTDIGLVVEIGAGAPDVSSVGTEGYIAPEGPGTPAADVYSLGKLIYEVSIGQDRRVFPELPSRLLEGELEPGLDQLYEITINACAPDLQKRYPTAAALKTDLVRLQTLLSSWSAADGQTSTVRTKP